MICTNADAMDGDLVAGLWPSSQRMNVSSIRSSFRFPSTSHAMDRCGARACRYDPGATTAVLGRRAVAPYLAPSLGHDHREYAEPRRIPWQSGLTTGGQASKGPRATGAPPR